MGFKIRPYHSSDFVSLYRICLKTGDSGKDASNIYTDQDLLGHIYVGPYAVFEPELCFVVSKSDKPYGYILGTRDTQKFYEKCEKEWFPLIRNQYQLSDDEDKSVEATLIRRLHQKFEAEPGLEKYPAHLHIDILPQGQGFGLGWKLMKTFMDKLRELKVKGLHLGVGKKNQNAIKFYKHIGFQVFKEYENHLILILDL
jgi:ribosomal protein S18 acetylase RimI-like enzyme